MLWGVKKPEGEARHGELFIKQIRAWTDVELCKALSMDELKLAEAFRYSYNTVATAFDDDTYEVDTDGLLLANDEDIKLAAVYMVIMIVKIRNRSSNDDLILAAAFG